jgi:hypothetical protein
MSGFFYGASVFSFAISLILPCMEDLGANKRYIFGFTILILGWSIYFLPWLANFFLLFAFLFFKRNAILTLILCSLGFFLGLTSYQLTEFPDISLEGTPSPGRFMGGFYFWMGSFVILAIGCFFRLRNRDV